MPCLILMMHFDCWMDSIFNFFYSFIIESIPQVLPYYMYGSMYQGAELLDDGKESNSNPGQE